MLNSLRGSGLKTRLKRPVEAFWDWRLGINTTVGFIPHVGEFGDPLWRGAYVPTTYRRTIEGLRHVGVGPSDVVVDLGCGLGRAVFIASWLGAKRSVGVEIDASLAEQATCNMRTYRGLRQEIEIVCAGAETYPLANTTVLFMFNPFGAGTMAEVVRGLEQTATSRTRQLRIFYENPLQSEVLARSAYLEQYDEWAGGTHGSPHPAAFWRTIAR